MSDKRLLRTVIFPNKHPKNISVKYTMFPSIPSHPQIFKFPYPANFLFSLLWSSEEGGFFSVFSPHLQLTKKEQRQKQRGVNQTGNFSEKERKRQSTEDIYLMLMRTTKGIIWEFLTFPNASKDPRKYEEEMRKNQLYETIKKRNWNQLYDQFDLPNHRFHG